MSENAIKYPKIEVQLNGNYGNAFYIVSAVKKALSVNGIPKEEIKAYEKESFSGDFEHLLSTAQLWVTVN